MGYPPTGSSPHTRASQVNQGSSPVASVNFGSIPAYTGRAETPGRSEPWRDGSSPRRRVSLQLAVGDYRIQQIIPPRARASLHLGDELAEGDRIIPAYASEPSSCPTTPPPTAGHPCVRGQPVGRPLPGSSPRTRASQLPDPA